MLDYIILLFLVCLASYCHILAIRLKKLKFGALAMQMLLGKLSALLIRAEKSKDGMVQSTNQMVTKLENAKVDTTKIIDDLDFMAQRAEKIITHLDRVIENDRRLRNGGADYNFKELLLKMAR